MDILSLVTNTDFFTKIILIILTLFSVVSWGLFLTKYFILRISEKDSLKFKKKLEQNKSFDKLIDESKIYNQGYLTALYTTAFREMKSIKKSQEDLKTLERYLNITKEDILNSLDYRTGVIASIASASPLIGLLGTVWGIMNSFIGLTISQNTTITAVAPGIAAALITTIFGLIVAIPSVIFFNYINNKIDHIDRTSSLFINEIINHVYKNFNK
jgi:biopolymer transport protein TolQ